MPDASARPDGLEQAIQSLKDLVDEFARERRALTESQESDRVIFEEISHELRNFAATADRVVDRIERWLRESERRGGKGDDPPP